MESIKEKQQEQTNYAKNFWLTKELFDSIFAENERIKPLAFLSNHSEILTPNVIRQNIKLFECEEHEYAFIEAIKAHPCKEAYDLFEVYNSKSNALFNCGLRDYSHIELSEVEYNFIESTLAVIPPEYSRYFIEHYKNFFTSPAGVITLCHNPSYNNNHRLTCDSLEFILGFEQNKDLILDSGCEFDLDSIDKILSNYFSNVAESLLLGYRKKLKDIPNDKYSEIAGIIAKGFDSLSTTQFINLFFNDPDCPNRGLATPKFSINISDATRLRISEALFKKDKLVLNNLDEQLYAYQIICSEIIDQISYFTGNYKDSFLTEDLMKVLYKKCLNIIEYIFGKPIKDKADAEAFAALLRSKDNTISYSGRKYESNYNIQYRELVIFNVIAPFFLGTTDASKFNDENNLFDILNAFAAINKIGYEGRYSGSLIFITTNRLFKKIKLSKERIARCVKDKAYFKEVLNVKDFAVTYNGYRAQHKTNEAFMADSIKVFMVNNMFDQDDIEDAYATVLALGNSESEKEFFRTQKVTLEMAEKAEGDYDLMYALSVNSKVPKTVKAYAKLMANEMKND